jgi:protein TonB
MMNKYLSKILMAVGGLVLSALLILSIPVLNLVIKGDFLKKETSKTTQIEVKQLKLNKPKPKPKKKLKRPKRAKAKQRNIASGPRFAMDLGLAGLGGAFVPANMVNASRGAGGEAGEVDQKPVINGSPPLELPSDIREKEVDAYLVISFCVNVQGNAYDLKVLEEEPKGMGLARAGKTALLSTPFSPAVLDGTPVAFCGMELPFEVRFSE